MISNIIQRFNRAELYPKIGIEIEFYLPESGNLDKIEEFIFKIVPQIQMVKEVGEHQYELIFPPSQDLESYVELIDLVRRFLKSQGAVFKVIYQNELPPSALHLHINLLDSDRKNKFLRKGNNYNSLTRYAIGGLCDLMVEAMVFMMPDQEDYDRFKTSQPINISWGANNRTVAIRLPENVPENFRIEYRVISPAADLTKVISVILIGIYHGIKKKIEPSEKIYSIASEKLHLPKFPASLEEANQQFLISSKLKNYLEMMK